MVEGIKLSKITIQLEGHDLSEGSAIADYRLPEWVKQSLTDGITVYVQTFNHSKERATFKVSYSHGWYKLLPEHECVEDFSKK
jgi:hypothetical protein